MEDTGECGELSSSSTDEVEEPRAPTEAEVENIDSLPLADEAFRGRPPAKVSLVLGLMTVSFLM